MAMYHAEVRSDVSADAAVAYAHLFQALADPTRLVVLQHLAYGEHRVRDLTDHLRLAQSTVSKHLSFLLECELVTVRPAGRASVYALADHARLSGLIRAAGALLDATGHRVRLCRHLTDTEPRPRDE